MAVLKNKTQGTYTIVSQNIMRDKNLTLTERGMLLTLLSLPDNWHLTIKGLTQILPDGKDRISNTLNSLIEKGYVTRVQSRGIRGKFDSTDLEVHEVPILTKESSELDNDNKKSPSLTGFSPCPENPHTVNPDTDNPFTENPTQYNNNIFNTYTSNNHKECKEDALSDSEYESLVSLFGKDSVDYQINRITNNNYKGCRNYSTIKAWCEERRNRPHLLYDDKPKKNSFNDFPQRTDIDFDAIEQMILAG